MTAIKPLPTGRTATPPDGPGGVFMAVLILAAMLGGAALLGWLLSGLTANIFPAAPPYMILVYIVVLLLLMMPVVARLFPWISNWYYLFPALVFLAAFTILPIVMTVNYAFTNYSAQNSNSPDSAARTDATLSADRTTVNIKSFGDAANISEFLKCKTPNCAGETLVLFDEEASVPVRAKIASASGNEVKLSAPLAGDLKVAYATRINKFSYVGLANFREIFSKASRALWPVFLWTVVFALGSVIINAIAGLMLGILLYNKRLKFRNVYRTLLFLPWAIPAVISIQMWKALLNQPYGIINKELGLLGIAAVPWLGDPLWAKISILLVNLWLGFPYMMTATISALSTINDDLYEAASIDGANRWQQIQAITLPLLRTSFTPLLLSSFAFNFNNFGIIYLLTAGGPSQEGREATAQSTDILLSWGYNTAFSSGGGQNYALASAIALIIFFLTLAISVVNFKAAGVFEEARK